MTHKNLIVIAGVAIMVAAVTIVLFFRSGRENRNEQCEFNLMLMWRAAGVGDPSESPRWDPLTGRAFWDRHDEWPVRVRMELPRSALVCPVFDKTKPGPGVEHVDYRGPAKSLRLARPEDPLGADRPGNHPAGGNVLLKSGTVVSDAGAWSLAAGTTSD